MAGFKEDSRTHLAVEHQIMVIGEAARRLSLEVRDDMSSIPWSAIARMRDRLIHGYDTVDLPVVWDTVKRNIPGLLQAIRGRLANQSAD